jgi:methionyl-tRNA synthetase
MSKSKLTGIAPTDITSVFGADAFRYYFLRAITFGSDGSFSWEDLAARYEAELANGFGNLASRVIAMITKYCDGVVPSGVLGQTPAEDELFAVITGAVTKADDAMHRLQPHEALNEIWRIVEHTNGYITTQEPWVLAKDKAQKERLDAVLYAAADALRALAVVLSPFMPEATEKLWSALGVKESLGGLQAQNIPAHKEAGLLPVGSVLSPLPSLFPRVEQEE